MDFKSLTLKEKAEVFRTLADIEHNLQEDIERNTKEVADLLNTHLERTKTEEGYTDSWEASYALSQIDDRNSKNKGMRAVLEYLNKLS